MEKLDYAVRARPISAVVGGVAAASIAGVLTGAMSATLTIQSTRLFTLPMRPSIDAGLAQWAITAVGERWTASNGKREINALRGAGSGPPKINGRSNQN